MPQSLVAQVGLLHQRLLLVGKIPPRNWETLGLAESIGPNQGWRLPALFPWIIPRPNYIHSLGKRLNALCMIRMLYGHTLPGLHPFPLFRHPWVTAQSITNARLTLHLLHRPLEGTKGRLGCLDYLVHLIKGTRPNLQPHLCAMFLLHHLRGRQKGHLAILLPLTAGKQSYLFGNLVGSTHHHPLGIGCMVIAPEPKPLSWKSHSDGDHTTSYKPRRTTRFTDGPRLKQLDALAKDIEWFDPEKQDHNVEDYLREIAQSLLQREKIKLIWKTTSRSIHGFIVILDSAELWWMSILHLQMKHQQQSQPYRSSIVAVNTLDNSIIGCDMLSFREEMGQVL